MALVTVQIQFLKSADISWMTEMESNGYTWKDNNGNTRDLMPLLTDYELNAIRLRVSRPLMSLGQMVGVT